MKPLCITNNELVKRIEQLKYILSTHLFFRVLVFLPLALALDSNTVWYIPYALGPHKLVQLRIYSHVLGAHCFCSKLLNLTDCTRSFLLEGSGTRVKYVVQPIYLHSVNTLVEVDCEHLRHDVPPRLLYTLHHLASLCKQHKSQLQTANTYDSHLLNKDGLIESLDHKTRLSSNLCFPKVTRSSKKYFDGYVSYFLMSGIELARFKQP